MKKIGIEQGLSNVVNYLTNEGYSVEVLSGSGGNNRSKLSGFDAIVTSGLDTDMLGISDTETKAPVISAKGLSPEEVKEQLNNRLS